jgi:hypothetical protein
MVASAGVTCAANTIMAKLDVPARLSVEWFLVLNFGAVLFSIVVLRLEILFDMLNLNFMVAVPHGVAAFFFVFGTGVFADAGSLQGVHIILGHHIGGGESENVAGSQ